MMEPAGFLFFFFFFSTFGPVAGCDVFTHSLSVDPRKQI